MSLGARCSMYYSQNFTAKKSKTRTEPYLSLMTLYPRVDNKNNAKDPTRFHFSLRLSYNPFFFLNFFFIFCLIKNSLRIKGLVIFFFNIIYLVFFSKWIFNFYQNFYLIFFLSKNELNERNPKVN
jgi:hypothetical protein